MEGIVWITGANGLIGNHLMRTAPQTAPGWEVIGLTRARADVTDFNAVRELFRARAPQLIIHCAALSRSPACQENPSLGRKVNVEATACLAGLAANIPFVFLSSDLVFDGRQGNYDESARPNPLSVYAETKLAAEQIVLANPKHTVVRLSLNGGVSPSGDRAFNEEMRRAWRERKTLKLFVDEFRSPLPAIVTARAIWELVAQSKPGLYHLAGSQRLSRWEMGRLIAARSPQLNPQLEPASRKDYTGPPRPADTSLNCAKIQKLLSFPLPGLGEWLKANPKEPF
jgi:dTDP-4-dehydrorhamnose reductase